MPEGMILRVNYPSNMIWRRCVSCRGTNTAPRAGHHSTYWCTKCSADRQFDPLYKIQITLAVGSECLGVCLFDEQAVALMGMQPNEWVEHLQNDPDAAFLVEDALAGQFIHVDLKSNSSKQSDPSKLPEAKCSGLRLGETFVTMADYLRLREPDQSLYDPETGPASLYNVDASNFCDLSSHGHDDVSHNSSTVLIGEALDGGHKKRVSMASSSCSPLQLKRGCYRLTETEIR